MLRFLYRDLVVLEKWVGIMHAYICFFFFLRGELGIGG